MKRLGLLLVVVCMNVSAAGLGPWMDPSKKSSPTSSTATPTAPVAPKPSPVSKPVAPPVTPQAPAPKK